MKKITPMQRLKDDFNKFKKLTTDITEKEIVLQKSSSKFNPYGGEYGNGHCSKEVKSDFIRIFITSKDKSFAFAFDNIDADLDMVLLTVTIKYKLNIQGSSMKFKQFKSKFKELIKTLEILKEVKSLNTESLYTSLEKIFGIGKPTSKEELVKNILKEISKEIKPIKEKQKRKKISLNKISDIVLENKNKLEEFISELKQKNNYEEVHNKFLEIQREFKEIERKIEKEKKEKEKELKYSYYLSRKKSTMNELSSINENLYFLIEKHTKPYSKEVREAIVEKIIGNYV